MELFYTTSKEISVVIRKGDLSKLERGGPALGETERRALKTGGYNMGQHSK
jgi:hypothetical protein